MRSSPIFVLGGILLSFTNVQAQDDCLSCAVGNFVQFLGEQAADAIISGAGALKGAFEAAPASDNNNIDPYDAILDEPQPPSLQLNLPPAPPPQLPPQQDANPVDAEIELLNFATSIPPAQETNRCDPQRTSVSRDLFTLRILLG